MFEDPTETTVSWPEIADVERLDLPKEFVAYKSHGMPILARGDLIVVSVPEGSEEGLQIVQTEAYDHYVGCVAVRRRSGQLHVSWWARLEAAMRDRGIGVCRHDRHDVLEVLAHREFFIGLRALEDCVELVRGEGIQSSPEAMRSEKALTRAIEVLRSTGFRAPRNG